MQYSKSRIFRIGTFILTSDRKHTCWRNFLNCPLSSLNYLGAYAQFSVLKYFMNALQRLSEYKMLAVCSAHYASSWSLVTALNEARSPECMYAESSRRRHDRRPIGFMSSMSTLQCHRYLPMQSSQQCLTIESVKRCTRRGSGSNLILI